jgi:hypothetical protein
LASLTIKMKRGRTTLASSTSTHHGDEGSIEGRTSVTYPWKYDDLKILFKNVMNLYVDARPIRIDIKVIVSNPCGGGEQDMN